MLNHFFSYAAPLLSLFLLPVLLSGEKREFDYQAYAVVLEQHVDERGLVAYARLKENRRFLDAFLRQLEELPRGHYESWDQEQQIAFWINAYNALTLRAIIDHYPIKAGFFSSLIYPRNSIRQIDGVWDKLRFPVMGERLTLDEIEHEILRKKFQEPRIHVALVCAAKSCPPLRTEPFLGEKLDEQLGDQTRRFVQRPENFQLESARGRLTLSSIFDWFGEDFVDRYDNSNRFSGYDQTVRAVLNYLAPYLDKATREALEKRKFRVTYSDYDWSLNEE